MSRFLRHRDLTNGQHRVINTMRALSLPLRWRLALIARWRRPVAMAQDHKHMPSREA